MSNSGAGASGFWSNDASHSLNASPVGVPFGHLTHLRIAFGSVNGLAVVPQRTVYTMGGPSLLRFRSIKS